MKVTYTLTRATIRNLKLFAVNNEKSLSDVVEEAVNRYMGLDYSTNNSPPASQSISLNILDSFPDSGGVYMFLRGRDIVYVGSSIHLKTRIQQHLHTGKLDGIDKIQFFLADDERSCREIEATLIRAAQPKMNKKGIYSKEER